MTIRKVARWGDRVASLLLGQSISLLITGTGVFETLLADRGIDIPAVQAFVNYALLCAHLPWGRWWRLARGRHDTDGAQVLGMGPASAQPPFVANELTLGVSTTGASQPLLLGRRRGQTGWVTERWNKVRIGVRVVSELFFGHTSHHCSHPARVYDVLGGVVPHYSVRICGPTGRSRWSPVRRFLGCGACARYSGDSPGVRGGGGADRDMRHRDRGSATLCRMRSLSSGFGRAEDPRGRDAAQRTRLCRKAIFKRRSAGERSASCGWYGRSGRDALGMSVGGDDASSRDSFCQTDIMACSTLLMPRSGALEVLGEAPLLQSKS